MRSWLALGLSVCAWGAVIERDPAPLGAPYTRYRTIDAHGRRIVFYVSDDAGGAAHPLAVFIQGSGCDSVFAKTGPSAQVSGRLQNVLRGAGKGRVRVMAVEKPGVEYLDASKQPGSAMGCSETFLEQHTLPRWAEAIQAAIRGALTLPGIDPARVM